MSKGRFRDQRIRAGLRNARIMIQQGDRGAAVRFLESMEKQTSDENVKQEIRALLTEARRAREEEADPGSRAVELIPKLATSPPKGLDHVISKEAIRQPVGCSGEPVSPRRAVAGCEMPPLCPESSGSQPDIDKSGESVASPLIPPGLVRVYFLRREQTGLKVAEPGLALLVEHSYLEAVMLSHIYIERNGIPYEETCYSFKLRDSNGATVGRGPIPCNQKFEVVLPSRWAALLVPCQQPVLFLYFFRLDIHVKVVFLVEGVEKIASYEFFWDSAWRWSGKAREPRQVDPGKKP